MKKSLESQAFHGTLRKEFVVMWELMYPTLNGLYTMDSLRQFEAIILDEFQQIKDVENPIYMPLLLTYAYYLGETLVRSYPNAKWVYPKGKNPHEAKVSIKQPNKHEVCIIPFNTVYKLITGKSRNLMSIIEGYNFVMKNQLFIERMEKGKSTKLPNGGYIRTYATDDMF